MPITIPDDQLRTMARQIDELAVRLEREQIAGQTSVWFLQGTLYSMTVQALGLEEADNVMQQSHAIAHRLHLQDERIERGRHVLERVGLRRPRNRGLVS